MTANAIRDTAMALTVAPPALSESL
jgi:hypothetical protein